MLIGNKQNFPNCEPWVSTVVAQPDLWLMGWIGCSLYLPDHRECYLSVNLTDHPDSRGARDERARGTVRDYIVETQYVVK